MIELLITILQVIGWAVLAISALVSLIWIVGKMNSATDRMKARVDEQHPSYEVRIYRKNGELAKKGTLGYTDMIKVRKDLKSQYRFEIRACNEIIRIKKSY